MLDVVASLSMTGAGLAIAGTRTPFVTSAPLRVSRVEDSPKASPGNQQAVLFVWCA